MFEQLRPYWLRFVLSFVLSARFATGIAVAEPRAVGRPDPKPNIVLILSDDHSFPNLGCYGDPNAKTPNFDRFASDGMRFDRAYTMAPQCVPSRASILTGRSPIAVDMTRFSAPLAREFRTFPEVLRDHGYVTGVIGRYFHLDGPKTPKGITKRVFDAYKLASGRDRFDFVHVNGRIPRPPLREAMATFFESCDDKPFFLWANFNEPHRLWQPKTGPHPESLQLPPDFPDYPSVRKDLSNLYGILAQLDRKFGDLIKYLDERGVTLLSAGLDEVPMAYKDIDEVMAAQADLVDPVARFQPKIVKMAPAGERPED